MQDRLRTGLPGLFRQRWRAACDFAWRGHEAAPAVGHQARSGELAGLPAQEIGESAMALPRDFKATIRDRAQRDPTFRKALLREGIECMLSGDTGTGKTILRDYINATVGFAELAEATRIPSKSLMRMLGPAGNPRADNLFEVVSFLQQREGVRFHLKARPIHENRAASS